MKLIKISYKNFKGFKSFDFPPKIEGITRVLSDRVSVFGENETGKSTIFDGFTWVLFGKDSLNQADFNIKPIDPITGEDIHGLETEVMAIIEHKGIEIELKRIYSEKWTKTRGEAEKTLTGHTTDFYIDGVNTDTKRAYDEKIKSFADEQTFKLLTNPLYFNEQMHWEERRELIMKICGDVDKTDIFKSEPKLIELTEVLGNRTIDDHKKVLKEKRTRLNKELEKIPTRIDEVNFNKPDIKGMDFDSIRGLITDLKLEEDTIKKSIIEAKNGTEIGKQTLELAKIETSMLQLKNKYTEDNEQLVKLARYHFNEATNNFETAGRDLRSLTSSRVFKVSDLKGIEEKLRVKRDEWTEENENVFVPPKDPGNCFNCGQKMPEPDNSKAEETFNLQKSKSLEEITKNAQDVLGPLQEKYGDEILQLTRDIANSGEVFDELKKVLIEKQISYDNARSKQVNVVDTDEYKTLVSKKDTITKDIDILKTCVDEAIEQYNEILSEKDIQISQQQTELAKQDQYDKAIARIEDHKAEEKRLAKELMKIDLELNLTDLYIKTKVSLLDDKINSKFKMVRFKMFKTLVNGGIEDICESSYKGVPYSSMNNAARYNCGIDIINAISKYYDFTAPIFVDNAESVTDYIETKVQMIWLVVSAQDKVLRVEV